MSNVLASLHRLRSHARLEAEASLRVAERARDQQEVRLSVVTTAIQTAQASVDHEDVAALAAYQSFRIREEFAERRERARLQQKERDVMLSGDRHVKCVRDELTLEAVMEERLLEFQGESRRAEARGMDEIASRGPRGPR